MRPNQEKVNRKLRDAELTGQLLVASGMVSRRLREILWDKDIRIEDELPTLKALTNYLESTVRKFDQDIPVESENQLMLEL